MYFNILFPFEVHEFQLGKHYYTHCNTIWKIDLLYELETFRVGMSVKKIVNGHSNSTVYLIQPPIGSYEYFEITDCQHLLTQGNECSRKNHSIIKILCS